MDSKRIIVILGVLVVVVIGIELARPAMSPEADTLSRLGLGLAYGVGAAVLLAAVIRLWRHR